MNLADIIGEAIQALGSVPNGELYARLMGAVSYDEYTDAIQTLKSDGRVTEESHLLTWAGS